MVEQGSIPATSANQLEAVIGIFGDPSSKILRGRQPLRPSSVVEHVCNEGAHGVAGQDQVVLGAMSSAGEEAPLGMRFS